MILWSSKVEREETPMFAYIGRRSWRWVVEASRWESGKGASIGLYYQVLFEGTGTRPSDAKWQGAGSYYDISLTPHWDFGGHHAYYDGPHCSFSLGYLHFNWSGDDCEKCMPNGVPA